jgi:PAS domain S-box-containing protein
MNGREMNLKKDYVASSHKRCREYEVEQDRIYSKRMIFGNDLFKRLEGKKELIDTAERYMNKLYNFVKGSNFFALLTDEEGCILSIIGDASILTEAFFFKMVPGAYMDERSIGTNSMGTALAEGQPVQVSGEEHYIKAYHRWTCSASPIRNSRGEVIGSIDLTGYSEYVHLHTLGMVVAAADAIEEMLDIKRYTVELFMAKKFTETIMDSIEAGIFTSDLEGNIKTVNRQIADMFGYRPDEMKSMKTRDLLENWENVKASVINKQGFTDEDVFVNARRTKHQFNLSAYPYLDGEQNLMNIVFVFNEVKKVDRKSTRLNSSHT